MLPAPAAAVPHHPRQLALVKKAFSLEAGDGLAKVVH
jgi:hypothetical protein